MTDELLNDQLSTLYVFKIQEHEAHTWQHSIIVNIVNSAGINCFFLVAGSTTDQMCQLRLVVYSFCASVS